MTPMNRKIFIVALLIELFIIICLALFAFKPDEMLNVSAEEWSLSGESGEETDSSLTFVSPFFYIEKGSYVINVKYASDEDGIFSISSVAENAFNLDDYSTTIHSQRSVEKIEFEARGPVDNVQATITFNSAEANIYDINVWRTHFVEKRYFTIALFLFLLIDILYLTRKKIIENKIVIASIAIIGFVASIPYFSYGIEVGHDFNFDLVRIEGIAEELTAGHFPVRIQSFINYGYGFPLSIFYGDTIIYIPAVLRILGFNLVQAYKVYAIIINMLTASFAFYAGYRIFKKRNIAILFAASYTLSTYRFLDIYVRSSLGEYTAMVFFPLVLVGIYEIYFSNDRMGMINRRGLICLSCGMAGIITCHILSTQMMCTFLIVFALLFVKKTIQKPVIVTLSLSVALTFLLSAWFVIPFLDYYLSVDIDVNSLEQLASGIQFFGAFITQYFAVFKSLFGSDSDLIVNRFSVTPGLLLMTVLICAIIMIIYGKSNRAIKNVTASVLFLMFFSSNIFPWDIIGKTKMGNFLARIQFPWRWIGFACILLTLLLGLIIEYLNENTMIDKHLIFAISIVLLIIQVGANCSSYASDALSIRYPSYASDLDAKENRWYIRTGSDYDSYSFDVTGQGLVNSTLLKQDGTDYIYSVETNKNGDITFPILNYKGFKVWDETGKGYEIKDGNQKEISIILPDNYNGKIYVSFKEPIYWRISEIVSILTVLALAYLAIKTRSKTVTEYTQNL